MRATTLVAIPVIVVAFQVFLNKRRTCQQKTSALQPSLNGILSPNEPHIFVDVNEETEESSLLRCS